MHYAFENYEEIQQLGTNEEKQKLWLEDYHGLKYGIALDKKHQTKWKTNPQYYDMREFNPMINCIARKKDRLVIEFDEVEGDPDNAKESLEVVKETLKKNGWGYIQSTHHSKNSDYLWIEFNKDLTTAEAKRFLAWICPDGARIDLNFTSDAKLFPVLFARHWKYSQAFELPVDYHKGSKIDFEALGIPKQKPKETIAFDADGFAYQTYRAAQVFSPRGQAKEFSQAQPIFYDKAGLWWLWDPNKLYWETVDEVEILNMIESATGQDIITPKNRTLILNSLKQRGRKMIPEPIKPTWIQFKDTIVDVETGDEFEATPKYFVTNPIPWELEREVFETPNMDRIFAQWVGEDNVELLYEILAYCLLPDYPIHRIFCFIGSGMNGKSKYLELLRRFVGGDNCCSTELDTLISSRFEVTRLHKKLVCQMGETNFSEMNKTSIIKKLSGGDLIGFEYKNKNPFEEHSYAKILIATNNLPATTDKTIGFYRRWTIIDFPNQFTEKKDILGEIPDKEYNSLALRSVITLKRLLKDRTFTNEGNIEERMKKYEDKSNPLDKFINEYTVEDYDSHIWKWEFNEKLKQFCKENRFREISDVHLGKKMKQLGIQDKLITAGDFSQGKRWRAWMGLKWA